VAEVELEEPSLSELLDPRAAVERRHMLDTSAQDTLAFAFLATVGTGIILGLNRVTLNIIVWVADPLGESHKGSF
jgi:hypothetical protein